MCRSRSKRHHSWLELDSIAVFEPGGQYSPSGARSLPFKLIMSLPMTLHSSSRDARRKPTPNAAHALSSGSCAYIDPERQPVHVGQTLGQPTRKAAA
jgi:hypothetical protein